MARAGYCVICRKNVWLLTDGSCEFGHDKSSISNPYEAKKGQVDASGSGGFNRNGNPIIVLKGRNGKLELHRDFIRIDRGTTGGFLLQGLKGQKEINLVNISSIQVKKPGGMVGYIQFSLPGGNESRRGVLKANSDENTVTFGYQNLYIKAIQIKEYVQEYQRKSSQQVEQKTSTADEIEKLMRLRDSGGISENEFEILKKKLIGQ